MRLFQDPVERMRGLNRGDRVVWGPLGKEDLGEQGFASQLPTVVLVVYTADHRQKPEV